ncbi:MAG: Uncharacterized protein G01um10147_1162 [Microgenomates group bacterium Gr01-1014_7]|nr:MAG: Uncharacterized protein G01um10147_1162 [Microgenomates group bacterium Gr01-1014_7]
MADNKSGSLASGVAGAVIGAAAAAAAIALSDEKNRKKAERILRDLQKQGDKILDQISKRAMELKDMGLKALPRVKEIKKSNKGVKKIAKKATKK